MTNHIYTKESVLDALKANNYDMTGFRCGDDKVVCVTPCWDDPRDENTDRIDFFMMDSDNVVLWGSDKIEDVVKTLNSFSTIEDEDAEEKKRLWAFYNSHIKGKSDHGLDSYAIYSWLWDNRPENMSHTDFENSPETLKTLSAMFHAPEEHIKDVIELSEAWDCFSDWHKDLYGYRPR